MRALKAADLFCGAGGTTAGAEASGVVKCVFALNHWQVAVNTHSANFPHARHVNSRLEQCSPSECDKIDLLFASPECTHHSRARGGRPTSDQQRSGAWQILPWVDHHRPSFIVVENVVEFREWGPVGSDGRPLVSGKGRSFDAWLMALRAAGYRVDHRELNAADYGAATSRNRLFIIARKGSRSPSWPEPTHARWAGCELPGMKLTQWRSAIEVIDESIQLKSIGERVRLLSPKTLEWMKQGRNLIGETFGIAYYGNGGPIRLDRPLPTVTTRDRFGFVRGNGYRMFANSELSAAQGFAHDYIFTGTKAEVTRQIGNSVSPPVAKAICSAIAG